jgi:hypothetical protein
LDEQAAWTLETIQEISDMCEIPRPKSAAFLMNLKSIRGFVLRDRRAPDVDRFPGLRKAPRYKPRVIGHSTQDWWKFRRDDVQGHEEYASRQR